MILPTGEIIVESMAIIEYLNEIKTQPFNLFPGNPLQRAQIRAFCEVVNSGIHPYQNLHLINRLHNDYGTDKKQWSIEWMTKGLVTMEKLIEQN